MQLFMVHRLKIIEIQIQKAIIKKHMFWNFFIVYNVHNNMHARRILQNVLYSRITIISAITHKIKI